MLTPAKRGRRNRILFSSFLILILSLLVTILLNTGNYNIFDFARFYSGTSLQREALVTKVIDGDTVVIDGGERVRYIGIDTPERGRPFYLQSTARNRELVEGKKVELLICKERKRDKYGRLLAYVYADEADVSKTLLKEGLANVLSIPPCGKERKEEFYRYLFEAKKQGVGMWEGSKVER